MPGRPGRGASVGRGARMSTCLTGCSCSSRTSRCRTTCRAAVVQHGGVEAAEAEYGDDTAGGLSSYLHRSLSSLRIRRGCNAANGNKQIAPCLPPVVHLRLPPVAHPPFTLLHTSNGNWPRLYIHNINPHIHKNSHLIRLEYG